MSQIGQDFNKRNVEDALTEYFFLCLSLQGLQSTESIAEAGGRSAAGPLKDGETNTAAAALQPSSATGLFLWVTKNAGLTSATLTPSGDHFCCFVTHPILLLFNIHASHL